MLKLLDHVEAVDNLLLVLFLQSNDPVHIDSLFVILTMSLVFDRSFLRLVGISSFRRMAERPVVLNGNKLIQCIIIHQEDFLLSQAKIIFGH